MRHIKLILPRYAHDCPTDRFIGHKGNYDIWADDDGYTMRFGRDVYHLHRGEWGASHIVAMEQRIVATGGFQV